MKIEDYLQYNPDTGLIVWIKSPSKKVKVGAIAGSTRKDGYVSIRLNKKLYLAHRLGWYLIHNDWPDEVDHKDRNPSNNKLENLRLADRVLNNQNRHNFQGGIRHIKSTGKYQVRVTSEGKRMHLGNFISIDEAKLVYKQFYETRI